MIKIQMTYDRTSPESAEHGDFSDHGWYEPGGWYYSLRDLEERLATDGEGFGHCLGPNSAKYRERKRQIEMEKLVPDPAIFDLDEYEDLEEVIEAAVDYISDMGALESSGYPFQPGDWYTTVDPDMDYLTGEDTRHSFHVKASNDLQKEIHDRLKQRGMLL